jgi:hypothetical protein
VFSRVILESAISLAWIKIATTIRRSLCDINVMFGSLIFPFLSGSTKPCQHEEVVEFSGDSSNDAPTLGWRKPGPQY